MKHFFVKVLLLCAVSGATAAIAAAQKSGKVALASGGFPRVAGNLIGLGTRRIKITMPIRISAATNYRVELQKAEFGGDGIRASDIGFGVNAAVGAQISVAGNFAADPTTASVRNGYPLFAATLADIGETPTVIFTGAPVAARRKAGEDADSITVELDFVVVAQYFALIDNAQISLQLTIVPLD